MWPIRPILCCWRKETKRYVSLEAGGLRGEEKEEGEKIVWQLLQNCRQGESHTYTHSGGGVPSKFYHFSKSKMWEKFFFGLAWRVPCRLNGVVKQKRTSFGQADLQWFFLCASYQYEREFLLRLPLIRGGFFKPSSRTQEPYQVVKFRNNAREAFAWRAFWDGVASVFNRQAK